MTKDQLVDSVVSHYLGSHDFNGLSVTSLDVPHDEISPLLKELLREGLISINFGDRHPNPYILAFEPEKTDEQIKKIDTLGLKEALTCPPLLYHFLC